FLVVFILNEPIPSDICSFSLHDALPISTERWLGSYVTSAQAEVDVALSKKNTIPNASGVLFRKFDFEKWAAEWDGSQLVGDWALDRKSTRLNSSHVKISYAVFCL